MSESLHFVCAHCQGINRVPTDKNARQAKCGKCHQPVASGKPVALSDVTFNRFITKNDGPVLVDFWAEWCGPCRMMAPIFEQSAAANDPNIRFAKVDTEAAQQTAARFNIRSIPTMILFRQGKEVARQAGAMDLGRLNSWLNQVA
ncbi:MAG: thioredoxin 2 [Parasphingorhabdus sp.]|jgi:thioredoxin 2